MEARSDGGLILIKTDESNISGAEFELYLHAEDQATDRHVIDAVKTVCASIYDKIDSFDVIRCGGNSNATRPGFINVTPSLVRVLPAPRRHYFGDFTDPERLHGLLSKDQPSKLKAEAGVL